MTHERAHRSVFRALVQDFSPIWFTWCMNAGIISIIMHQLPYQFHGLAVLSTIAFVLELFLFVVFSLIFLTRLAWFRRTAYYEITGNMNDLALLSSMPISWMILASQTCLIVSNAYWGGHHFTIVGYVMWWVGVGWSISNLMFTLITLIRRHDASDRKIPPTIILAVIDAATVATTGGLIASYSHDISARLAVPVIIVSFLMVGISLFMSIFFDAYLFHALLTDGWPAADNIASLWLLAGPLGQCAGAIQLLGSSAKTYARFGGYNKGTFLTAAAAAPLYIACILIALLLTGLGIVWALLAFCAMVEKAWRRELKWNMTWNSIIFPLGTLATAFLLLSIEMDSPTFRTLTTALLIIMVFFFLLNAAFAAWSILKGELLVVRKNPRVKHED